MGRQLENHGIVLRLDLDDGVPQAHGHPHQIEEVFLNLVGNARDALDERDPEERDRWVQIRTRWDVDDAKWVIAEVADNGTGIDEGDQSRVFEPFFTTKETGRGTGLGLSIVYAIVKNHGGQIVCESERGTGTVFRVLLPVAEEA